MITGTVTEDLDLVVTIEVANSSGAFDPLEVVIDTGFNGDLALPRDVVRRLGLAYRGHFNFTLATGEVARLPNYEGVVPWHGRTLEVEILETESESLLGMELLMGSKITIHAQVGGDVLIEED